jgi:hypothetical protein
MVLAIRNAQRYDWFDPACVDEAATSAGAKLVEAGTHAFLWRCPFILGKKALDVSELPFGLTIRAVEDEVSTSMSHLPGAHRL